MPQIDKKCNKILNFTVEKQHILYYNDDNDVFSSLYSNFMEAQKC